MVHKSKSRSREHSEEENESKPFIKKEKLEERVLHSMSFYADNRLELVKQVFGTLKPKTIRNLTPEHIRDERMEDLEEIVLNELMCISTKRLRSIINDINCPTDTESSDDTDVEHQEQHVSLEEISSDSDIDNETKVSKKKSKKSVNVKMENGDGSKISILELLELQARARAIRSQLALEPVTKIELGSDTEEKLVDGEGLNGNLTISRPSSRCSSKTAQTNMQLNGTTSSPSTINLMTDDRSMSADTSIENMASTSAGVIPTKLRLQRNYRQKTDNKEDNQNGDEVMAAPVTEESPDVIPIVAEPETLVIDSSSESEEKTSGNAGKMATKRKISCNSNAADEMKALENNSENVEEPKAKELCLSDAEEGEIFEEEEEEMLQKQNDKSMESDIMQDEDEIEKQIINKESEKLVKTNEDLKKTDERITTTKTIIESSKIQEPEDNENDEKSENTEVVDDSKPLPNIEQNLEQMVYSVNDNKKVINNNDELNNDDDDDDEDDIISLEGGDLEMIDPDEITNQSTASSSATSKDRVEKQLNVEYDDIISLDSSDDDLIKDEEAAVAAAAAVSWQDRYMKSSKINKVLTASRINKRVREKLRAQKRESKAAADEAETRARAVALLREEANKKSFMSKHADGTIEQYKELLEIQKQQKK